jgi:sugar-specific transcriptional regulator TrmB
MENSINEKTKNALLKLGLSEKEIICYISLLEIGRASILDISRKSGLNRVTTYSAIDNLKKRGLIAETKKGKRKLFIAEDPDTLEKIVEEKKANLKLDEKMLKNLILPSLKNINVQQKNIPQIKFFEGPNGIYKVYDSYVLKSRDVIGCGSYDSVMKISSWDVEKRYISEMKKRKIFFRGILEDTEMNHKFDEISKGVMHNKFLPEGERVSADILAFGSMVALISYEKKVATLIEDESIAKSIRMYLEFMWERL